ncbi:DUF1847 domain-containing protein [candidate division GN15 bacterium]|nr:DUF1847 domain-containing protein [candidate division GN15 bacterium]
MRGHPAHQLPFRFLEVYDVRYGISILGDRVAPRCTCADAVLLVESRKGGVQQRNSVNLNHRSLVGLLDVLASNRVDTLVCGGISRSDKEFTRGRQIAVVDNVAGSVAEVVAAIGSGALQPGLGLSGQSADPEIVSADNLDLDRAGLSTPATADCLACQDHLCLRGKPCHLDDHERHQKPLEREVNDMLEAALDISLEDERTLCRLSELIYFCLEMRYQHLGLAYCIELQEPAEILTHVLRRFFVVSPVSCKIGGLAIDDPLSSVDTGPAVRGRRHAIACNPTGQAAALNRAGTEINVLVGLCMGADCIFARASHAPVSTLFVKDRSLANNPIGAVYSDYYLNEAVRAGAKR